MFTRHYDVIIAGLRPGALLAANLLAKRGLRVLALDQEPLHLRKAGENTFPHHDQILTGFDDPLLLASALDELTIHPGERRLVQAQNPAYQVILPEQRVDIITDSERYLTELKREFAPLSPDCIAAMEGLREEAGQLAMAWQDRRTHLPSPSLLQRVGHRFGKDRALFDASGQTYGEYLDGFDLPEDFRTFLEAQVAAFGMQVEPHLLPLPVAAHILLSARAGIYRHPTQLLPLSDLLKRRLKELRGELAEDVRIAAIDASWGKITRVELDDGSECDCDFLVWGASYDGLLEVLPENLQSRYASSSSRLPADHRRFTVHLVVDSQVIPEAMAENVVSMADIKGEFSNGNLLLASTRVCEDGKSAITLSTLVDADFSPEDQERLAKEMVSHFSTYIPFLERYLGQIYLAPEGSHAQNDAFAWSASIVSHPFAGDLGPGPRMPHMNLFHCGRGTYPLLGTEGEFAAGILTVDAICAAVK